MNNHVAYSPLARGLSGAVTPRSAYAADDFRQRIGWWALEHYDANVRIVDDASAEAVVAGPGDRAMVGAAQQRIVRPGRAAIQGVAGQRGGRDWGDRLPALGAALAYAWRAVNTGSTANIRDAQQWLHHWRPGFTDRMTHDWLSPDCIDGLHH